MNYLPVELHTHSVHSDGKLEIEKLIEESKAFGYEAIFLTDHNTMSGLEDVKTFDLPLYKGVEWSTFHGHLLILGLPHAYDWTRANVDNLANLILEIKKDGNFVFGIAHPRLIGSPLCMGCHWDFNLKNYDVINFIEVYNGPNPHENYSSELNYQFWLDRVLEGNKIAPVAGRDWHTIQRDMLIPLTFLGIEGTLSEAYAIEALRKGRTYVSLGPVANLSISSDREYQLGDTATNGRYNFKIILHSSSFIEKSSKEITLDRILLFNNEEVIEERAIKYNEGLNFKFDLKRGFFRFEVLGEIDDKKVRLLISAPLWIGD